LLQTVESRLGAARTRALCRALLLLVPCLSAYRRYWHSAKIRSYRLLLSPPCHSPEYLSFLVSGLLLNQSVYNPHYRELRFRICRSQDHSGSNTLSLPAFFNYPIPKSPSGLPAAHGFFPCCARVLGLPRLQLER
jgi:hypothetical protein